MRNFTDRPWCKTAALALFAAGQPYPFRRLRFGSPLRRWSSSCLPAPAGAPIRWRGSFKASLPRTS